MKTDIMTTVVVEHWIARNALWTGYSQKWNKSTNLSTEMKYQLINQLRSGGIACTTTQFTIRMMRS